MYGMIQRRDDCDPVVGGNCNPGGTSNNKGSNSSTTSSTAASSSTASSSSSGIVQASHSPDTSSLQSGNPSGVSPGATAGAAAGCLIAGLVLGSLFALLLLRKKYNRKLRALERRHDMEKEDLVGTPPKTLLYASPSSSSDPVREAELQDARKRIKALEVERNAASAFGDTLDGQSEQELLDSPKFGLKSFNEKLHQLAMAISVSSNGVKGQARSTPPPQGLGDGLATLESLGRDRISQDIEGAVRHVINSVIFHRICAPFTFVADPNTSNNVAQLNKRVEKQFDQAMAARWRIMSHKTLVESAEDPSGKTILAEIQQTIFNALVETLIWANVEDNLGSASNVVSKHHARIVELTKLMGLFMHTIREEMTTANFEVDRATPISKALTHSLGLSARANGSSKKDRVILEAK